MTHKHRFQFVEEFNEFISSDSYARFVCECGIRKNVRIKKTKWVNNI